MSEHRGSYIVLEGPQGVGKSTQIELLAKRFIASGQNVRLFREPDSQSDLTARAIRSLTQDPHYPMNTRTEVLLYNAARSQSLEVIRRAREQGLICLCDRNYLTTLALQYYGRGDIPDYEMIETIINFAVGDMQPDQTIILDAPVETLLERAKKRSGGDRFDNLDTELLARIRSGYLWEAKQRHYPVVTATESADAVNRTLWNIIKGRKRPMQANVEAPVSDAVPLKQVMEEKLDKLQQPTYLTKIDEHYEITKDGYAYLEEAVTDTKGDVYAFKPAMSPVTIAAAMARLSRRGDDMRITILDEFAGKADKDEQLLKRVITAYGDDSVQQLASIHLVVENASNLLTKKLEWGRLASYLEQSTRYIYFDQTDKNGNYRYFIPSNFSAQTRQSYKESMDRIFELYSQMAKSLSDHLAAKSTTPENERDGPWRSAIRAQACDAIRAVLPVATTSTVGIYASGQALENLIMHLQSDPMIESRRVGDTILQEARKVMPVFLERADKPERGGATVAYQATTAKSMEELAATMLPPNNSLEVEDVQLTSYWPRNELDLVADMLYEYCNLPLNLIQAHVATWTYQEKVDAFNAYMGERLNRRHRPGRALEKAHYSWDLVCDYGIFRDLQRHRMVDDLAWQTLTPRYGYDIPELVEQAGVSDLFEQCFDISLDLYSRLQADGYEREAQYATLLGHKMRWKVTYNARQAFHLHELRTTPQGHPGYRKLVKQMHQLLQEVHPLLGEAMRFVNQDEDPELTRLAAERYSQFKLEQLEKSEG